MGPTPAGGKMAATARAPCIDGGRQPMTAMESPKNGDDLAIVTIDYNIVSYI
jgi:hypothetical protein